MKRMALVILTVTILMATTGCGGVLTAAGMRAFQQGDPAAGHLLMNAAHSANQVGTQNSTLEDRFASDMLNFLGWGLLGNLPR